MLRSLLSAFTLIALAAMPATAAPPKPAAKKAAPAKAAPPRPADWTRTITLGPNGAYILGNPAAPTKLVEYMSYTCPHCSHFQKEAGAELKAQWIRRGLVSLEYRNFVRDAFDLSAALLARCGGATRFLGNHEALFANHDAWIDRAETYKPDPAQTDKVAQVTDIADKTGLFALLAKRGLTPAAQKACLADPQAMSAVLGLTAGAWDSKDFSGTPFFLINGKSLPDAHDWASLKPLLPAPPLPLPRPRK